MPAIDRKSLLGLGVLVIAIVLLWFPSLHNEIVIGASNHDYPTHISYARLWYRTGTLVYPHFLFHALVLLVHVLISDFNTAGIIAALAAQCGLAVILYTLIYGAVNRPNKSTIDIGLSLAATFFLLVIGPITVFTWRPHNLYLGYINPTVYHSPLVALVKPLALLHFWMCVQSIQYPQSFSAKVWQFVFAGLSLLTLLALPNYMFCLIPTLVVLVIYRLYKRQRIGWPFLAFTVLVPAIVVLALQFFHVYAAPYFVTPSRVIIAPFAVLAPASKDLLPKFFLSILFPLAVYLLFFKSAWRSWEMNFAWLLFIFGAFQTYFLAESGNRFTQGNFLWSAQIALFLLMVTSLLFLLKQRPFRQPAKLLVCTFILSLHIISGLVFYVIAATLPGWNWW